MRTENVVPSFYEIKIYFFNSFAISIMNAKGFIIFGVHQSFTNSIIFKINLFTKCMLKYLKSAVECASNKFKFIDDKIFRVFLVNLLSC
jgi:hypothetical protein